MLTGSWSDLPPLALTAVYQCLGDTDRRHMAETCRSWHAAIDSPRLWRRRLLDLDGEAGRRSCLFVQRFGCHLRDLTVICLPCSSLADPCREACLVELLRATSPCRLLEFTFIFSPMELTGAGLAALVTFLAGQTRLCNLQVFVADCSLEVGLRLLRAVGEASGHCLLQLEVDELFQPSLHVYREPGFLSVLGLFRALSHVSLSYDCLGEASLMALARSVGAKLTSLTITVQKMDSDSSRVTSSCWLAVRALCPRLAVRAILGLARPPMALALLAPRAPVKAVSLACCPSPVPQGTPNPNSMVHVVRHLDTYFRDQLEELHLNDLTCDLAEPLLALVPLCPKLRSVHLTSDYTAAIFAVADQICRLQEQRQTHLQELSVIYKKTTMEDIRTFEQLESRGKAHFDRLHFSFFQRV